MSTKHFAVHPSGTTACRTSKNRVYTHAVWVTVSLVIAKQFPSYYGPLGVRCIAWSGSESLAQKVASKHRGTGYYLAVDVTIASHQ